MSVSPIMRSDNSFVVAKIYNQDGYLMFGTATLGGVGPVLDETNNVVEGAVTVYGGLQSGGPIVLGQFEGTFSEWCDIIDPGSATP